MIEIIKRNNIWECYVDGGLYEYNENLQQLLETIARKAIDIQDEIIDNQES